MFLLFCLSYPDACNCCPLWLALAVCLSLLVIVSVSRLVFLSYGLNVCKSACWVHFGLLKEKCFPSYFYIPFAKSMTNLPAKPIWTLCQFTSLSTLINKIFFFQDPIFFMFHNNVDRLFEVNKQYEKNKHRDDECQRADKCFGNRWSYVRY